MAEIRSSVVRHAVVLAAGNGDRFRNGSTHSKLITPVAGTPLLIRTLNTAASAGITDLHLILGYDADRVRALAASEAPDGVRLHFHVNHDWHQENGLSVLAAREPLAGQAFALLMGDHIFDAHALRQLAELHRDPGDTLLGVDPRPALPEVVAEATRVRLDGDRVMAIGKDLDPYNALDTGLFVCSSSVFEALERSCAEGDTTLSGGIRRLAASGRVRGIDIGVSRWCDIDTVDDLAAAEELVGAAGHARQ
jgi:choline kinase